MDALDEPAVGDETGEERGGPDGRAAGGEIEPPRDREVVLRRAREADRGVASRPPGRRGATAGSPTGGRDRIV